MVRRSLEWGPVVLPLLGAVLSGIGVYVLDHIKIEELHAGSRKAVQPGARKKLGRWAKVVFAGALLGGFGGVLAYFHQTVFEAELRGSILGGDTFCFVQTIVFGLGQEAPLFSTACRGQYPAYDVTIWMIDEEKLDRLEEQLKTSPRGAHDERLMYLESQATVLQRNFGTHLPGGGGTIFNLPTSG